MLLAACAAVAEERGLKAVHYDMLVVDQCGLSNDSVIAGYRAEYAAVVARDALDETAQRDARLAALIAFDYEYQNRGLGGARAWCRTEGADGAARLAAFAEREG
jgi:hypothetical protein